MTAKQFRQWELYDEVEPIGDVRSDYQSAQIVQTLYNVNRGKKDKPLKIQDCVLKFGGQDEKPKKTPEQMFAMLKILSAMHANEGAPVPALEPAAVLSPVDKIKAIAGDDPRITFA
jgi:hypothetical protein